MVVEKRRVTMHNPDAFPPHGCTDYVPIDILDAYVRDARTRWAVVEVGTEHDPGPAGDGNPLNGETNG